MRNNVLTYLLAPLFTCLSFSISAAPAAALAPVVEQIELRSATSLVQVEKVDINRADASTLQSELNGIGKAKAEAIVAYREAHGPFQSVDELLEIKGIGNALLERNREKLKVD
ncbi:ComEA family DNA-binding protein [Pseudomonas mosselii]|uniref:ComEA family DNA-binding protein n=1 Tax=Pseudomonas mosselii TaxID=78327 RepID=UPI001F2EF924|nr:ComEA family DNA-binding protein [Pseudomonas mosselii]MDH0629790.1 ComEA family DNA-binding protein [Pseudomonas mosselii]MDH0678894.1 ComEA family DNA-binding protein [Pseudomonas mosselii]MDH0927676.1 ComEA family DNA-binding protein [Pseudomonas mosselii]MDH1135743.1 ComEA family DNA-binding protein [Pseudomonas mosselii]MDH1140240.1 ComEA family DNA-binding protein [Pseudomonas mosselii]